MEGVNKIAACGNLSALIRTNVLYVWGNPSCKEGKQYDIPAAFAVTDKMGVMYEGNLDFKN